MRFLVIFKPLLNQNINDREFVMKELQYSMYLYHSHWFLMTFKPLLNRKYMTDKFILKELSEYVEFVSLYFTIFLIIHQYNVMYHRFQDRLVPWTIEVNHLEHTHKYLFVYPHENTHFNRLIDHTINYFALWRMLTSWYLTILLCLFIDY